MISKSNIRKKPDYGWSKYELNGVSLTLMKWCEIHGVEYNTAYVRLKRGKSIEEALQLIPQPKRIKKRKNRRLRRTPVEIRAMCDEFYAQADISSRYLLSEMYPKVIVGIYRIRCLNELAEYIGYSRDIFKRWACHTEDLNNRLHHCKKLQHAWDTFGPRAFIFELVLEMSSTDTELLLQDTEMSCLKETKCQLYNTIIKLKA